MTELLPPKKEVALALLERSNVDVYLDPRARGVVVPPQFRTEPRLILKVGLNMPVPIPDLRVEEDSMSCTLSFNRSPFYCVVPWSGVFAMVGEDGRGMVWPDDVPQELAVKTGAPADGPRAVETPSRPLTRPRSVPRAVPSAPEATPASEPSNLRAPKPRRGAAGGRRASKLAEDVPSPPDDRASAKALAGTKRRKKKDEPRPRPVLVSLPTAKTDESPDASSKKPREIRRVPGSLRPDASQAGQASQASQSGDAEQPAASPPIRDGVSMVPTARRRPPASPASGPSGDGTPKPKRELPPYLRIVK